MGTRGSGHAWRQGPSGVVVFVRASRAVAAMMEEADVGEGFDVVMVRMHANALVRYTRACRLVGANGKRDLR